jgi:hypothetical protein
MYERKRSIETKNTAHSHENNIRCWRNIQSSVRNPKTKYKKGFFFFIVISLNLNNKQMLELLACFIDGVDLNFDWCSYDSPGGVSSAFENVMPKPKGAQG